METGNKSNYLAGKGEINLSKIIGKGLINRTIEERQNDIKKGIYKEIELNKKVFIWNRKLHRG